MIFPTKTYIIIAFIVVLLSFSVVGFIIYNETFGATQYQYIDKSNYNLGISDELEKARVEMEEVEKRNKEIKTRKEEEIKKGNKEDKEEIEIEKNTTSNNSNEEDNKVKQPKQPSEYELKLQKLKGLEVPNISVREDLFHIVLLGLDSRNSNEKWKSRSDAILIVTMDIKKSEIRLTSVARDTLVLREGRLDKITHAFAYGGGTSTLRTLNSNFLLDIREFAAVTMFDVEEILKEFAPLKVTITEEERKEINYRIKEFEGIKIGNSEQYLAITDEEFYEKDNSIILEVGTLNLNKKQLLAYLRIRKTDSDFNRTNRHKEIITKILEKTKNMSATELITISKSVFPNILTSMEQSNINNKVLDLVKILPNMKIKMETFPKANNLYGNYINGVYYTDIKDRVKNATEMNSFIQGK